MNMKTRRRPVEAVAQRASRSIDCERRVRKALAQLTKTGAPFTVENVRDLAGVGKTFIYDKRRPELMDMVLTARDASQAAVIQRAEERRMRTRRHGESALPTPRRSRRRSAKRSSSATISSRI
jgi:hypothetical protein